MKLCKKCKLITEYFNNKICSFCISNSRENLRIYTLQIKIIEFKYIFFSFIY